jgi:RNA polymerase sigma-70 factor (ECF subfamily)
MSHPVEHIHLEGLQAGSKGSFEAIYQLHHQAIYFYCLKFLRQTELAEEATADVFVKLWKKRSIIDPAQSIAPFLYKLAKDIAYNYLRKIASDQRLRAEYLARYPLLNEQDGENIFIGKEDISLIQNLIEQLPPKRKAIFKLRYEEELDYESIARRLDISPNTVKVQLVKARKFLKQHMRESSIFIWQVLLFW